MEDSKFQFKNFLIKKSFIDLGDGVPSQKLTIGFNPRGIINKNESCFQLQLGIKINDEKNILKIEIEAVANFNFNKQVEEKDLGGFFYLNAPALLFPYVRAYISTLTNLSGTQPITLPTLNMTGLGEELRKNVKVISEEC